ncbi:hypothetical protein D6C77_03682 [Aureobasidium pullulans]|nr:hypothetical protein D6C77_03682 [Aureobasidium pullulans]
MLSIIQALSLAALATTVLANPLPRQTHHFKRTCSTGPGTSSSFLTNPAYSAAANNAATPSGYINTFTNLHASNNADGYQGYTILPAYDIASCANSCTARPSCQAFNVFFERTPPSSNSYNSTCSTATIKCVFWSGGVTAANAVNTGSTQNGFEIVIAGSNGYIKSAIAASPGYGPSTYLGNNAISAPNDCNGKNTYMGFQIFNDAPFNATRCAEACSAQSAYNIAHPGSDGAKPLTCQFFNTYETFKNGVSQGQWCVLYSQSWGKGVATNTGYTYGKDVYTIGSSYAYANATDAGVCVKA